ncbi:ATP-dependent RNA helicase SUPV3L1/SUV3 [Sphingobium sp. B1D7B]|nr:MULTISPECIES: helicase-related protein [unclassified Sphingobium]MCW2406812.1 ATP-dependent RNA helicase SUPV3L1/SUV3 [Sphingobium sp. B1D7B]
MCQTIMSSYEPAALKAVLGPTNTGKTHLAIERMCGHSSGLMGFPLRLLAREVYERVVRIKGADQVALLTGEERIAPPGARYVLATAEAMPVRGGFGAFSDFAFVAVDEIQLAADPERGHIFTDRMLNARGREETMLLGSASMAPLVRTLLPKAEIVTRPRFSTLRYSGPQKLSRLPRRCAVVAFSVEEVYRVAEMLRRHRGGAAIVMGALSPATRNAQVAMFEAGEVDYLVATDAIGMGLNLNVDHVAFASLRKFDGRRTRRLTVSEMAQIAGRAGRHQRDGTFGDVGAADGEPAFSAEEVERIEEHRFDPIEQIFWREADLPMDDIDTLIEALLDRPERAGLRAAPEAIDLAVLQYLADLPDVRARARGRGQVARLWAACSVPDFQKLGIEHHARTVHRLWTWLSQGSGHIPQDWFAAQLARLDNVQGDVDALAGRIGAVRIWAYVAQRDDWLAQPVEMAARARALEERLSDALHGALKQRFVDRRASALLRRGGDAKAFLSVDVDGAGNVTVDGHRIGTMRGFRFIVDPLARANEKRLLLAAAERRLGAHLNEMAQALLAVDDKAFTLASPPGGDAQIIWNGHPVATLKAGQRLLAPEMTLDAGLSSLVPEIQQGVRDRLALWLKNQFERHIPALLKMEAGSTDAELPATVRAVLAQLADAGGIVPRNTLDEALGQVAKEDRTHLRKAGVVIGVMDLYHPGLMKPAAAQWRMVLLSLKSGKPLVALPAPGAVLLQSGGGEERKASAPSEPVESSDVAAPAEAETEASAEAPAPVEAPASETPAVAEAPAPAKVAKPVVPIDEIGARIAGFRKLGEAWLRIDMAERLARGAHEAIAAGKPYGADDPTIVSIGLNEASFLELMRQAGFRPVPDAAEGAPNWQFRGRPKPRPKFEGPRNRGGNRRPAQQGRQDQDGQAQAAGDGPRNRPDRRGKAAEGGPRRERDKRPDRDNRSDRGQRPDRGPRPDRDGGGRERPIVATGKALAGLGALFGRED